ncbi:MAG: response regulator [Thermodesulfovibrionales bacterium]|nr:response regulator [Thermodesulfovibrionales bacterium]
MAKKPGTIFVVEDSQALRNLLSFVLEVAGYRVIPVSDEKELIKRLDLTGADLVITVLSHRRKDGVELIKNIRMNSGYRYIPVIALSSHEGLLARSREAGATDWLMMPFTPLQLVETVQRVLR